MGHLAPGGRETHRFRPGHRHRSGAVAGRLAYHALMTSSHGAGTESAPRPGATASDRGAVGPGRWT